MLNFSDGVSIDTSGDYRICHLKDGWYVIGHGMMLPADDQADAQKFIDEMKGGVKNDPAAKRS